MGKTLIYIVLLGILGFGVYYFLFREGDVFGTDEAGFTIKDTASVSRVFLADKKSNTILLERKSNGWMLNGKYPAMQTPVNNLLHAFLMQEPSYPVPESMHNSVVKLLAADGIKVEVYDANNKSIRTFYVGGQANDGLGTYMLIDGANRPYVVHIPGFNGYLTPRYSTDVADWRDRTVANVPRTEVKEVKVTYNAEPLNSFTLQQQDTGHINVVLDSVLMTGKELNKRRASVYTKFFEDLHHEGYLNGSYKLDSVIASAPKMCAIDITTTKGQQQHIDIYWMSLNKRSKNMLTPNPNTPLAYDADRFYAVINNAKDTVIIQRSSFDKILRRGYEFYQPDEIIPEKLHSKEGEAGVFHK